MGVGVPVRGGATERLERLWIEMTRHLSLILRSGVFAASRRMRSVASWFETAQERLLTMRGDPHQSGNTLVSTGLPRNATGDEVGVIVGITLSRPSAR
jgi:hypothetical protein